MLSSLAVTRGSVKAPSGGCEPALMPVLRYPVIDVVIVLSLRARFNIVIASLRSNLSFLVVSLRAQRGNLSFVCFPDLNNRDRFVSRDDRNLPWEAISLFWLCHCERSAAISHFCLLALQKRDRFVPRDDRNLPWEAISLFWLCHCERSAAISLLSVFLT